MLQLSNKEECLVLRRRKRWHKVLRRGGYIVLSVIVVVCLIVMVVLIRQISKKMAYQKNIRAIQLTAQTGGSSVFAIPANGGDEYFEDIKSLEARTAASYIELCLKKLDSLKLTADKRVGFEFSVTVVPYGVLGERLLTGRMIVYTSFCECEEDSLNQIVLQINSTEKNADVVSSQMVALASIQP